MMPLQSAFAHIFPRCGRTNPVTNWSLVRGCKSGPAFTAGMRKRKGAQAMPERKQPSSVTKKTKKLIKRPERVVDKIYPSFRIQKGENEKIRRPDIRRSRSKR